MGLGYFLKGEFMRLVKKIGKELIQKHVKKFAIKQLLLFSLVVNYSYRYEKLLQFFEQVAKNQVLLF